MTDSLHKFLSLPSERRREIHIHFCKISLKKWNEFIASKKKLEYRDSVVGLSHIVENDLPQIALEAVVTRQKEVEKIAQSYLEPITAIQNGDLEFPENIEFAYYSVYNLFRKYALNEKIDDWLIINQAISSEQDQGKWPRSIDEVINCC